MSSPVTKRRATRRAAQSAALAVAAAVLTTVGPSSGGLVEARDGGGEVESLGSPGVSWLGIVDTDGYARVEDVESLADGSSVVVGTFSETLTLGALSPVTAAGAGAVRTDIFAAKIGPSGTWQWVKRFGGSLDDFADSVDVFADGSVAISGRYQVSLNFGGSTPLLLADDGFAVFAGKLAPDGTPQWAVDSSASVEETIHGVGALADGSVAIVGTYEASISFDAFTLVSAGEDDVYVARTGPSGGWNQVARAGGTGNDDVSDVAGLSDGGLAIAGSFVDTATFGARAVTSAGLDDLYVAKLSATGEWSWVSTGGGTGYDGGEAISTPGDGTVLVAGAFDDAATIGTVSLANAGGDDVLVAKVGPLGAWIWAMSAGGAGNDVPESIDSWSDGSSVVTGHFTSIPATFGATSISTTIGGPDGHEIFVAKVARYGQWSWAMRAGDNGDDRGLGVTARPGCTSVAVGRFYGGADFGSFEADAVAETRGFVVGIPRGDTMLCTPLRVGRRGVTAKRIARYGGLALPAGSYAIATVPRTSSRYCRTNGYTVYSRSTGTCRVRVTVRDSRNRRLSSTVVFLPAR